VRDRVLSGSKVKFNNQIMTLKEFLALCGQGSEEQAYDETAYGYENAQA